MLYLWIFSGICLCLILWGMWDRERIYQFPFLAGAVFSGFVLPQLIGLANNPDIQATFLQNTLLVVTLAGAMCYLGYIVPCRSGGRSLWDVLDCRLDVRKLLIASTVLTAGGAFFFYMIGRLPEHLTEASQWSGLPVAFLFFASMLTYGLAIALLVYARTGNKVALVIAMVGIAFYLERIFIAARRGVTLELVFIVSLSLWFGRGRALPRSVVLLSILAGTLLLHSTGEYRSVSLDQNGVLWGEVRSIEYWDNLRLLMREGGVELTNAVYAIEAANATRQFDYGLSHWNALVFNYVPAQVMGADFKQSLMIDLGDAEFDTFGYTPHTGSTMTGMADGFRSFWYFGCLKFFLIAYVMRTLFVSAQRGNMVAQLLYMMAIIPSLHAITHSTHWFLSPWIHIALFVGPALIYARAVHSGASSLVAVDSRFGTNLRSL